MKQLSKKLSALLAFILLSTAAFSQAPTQVEMADVMMESGKIYVVVAVLVTIFAGIVIYLICIDRKLSRLENQQANENK